MNPAGLYPNRIYRNDFMVPESAVDGNGHVNNVVYVQWMQVTAALHADATGGTRAMQRVGAIWVARSHKIEYLIPAFAGEDVTALSWVVLFRGARSLRRYKFLRQHDETLLARGETEWVFVDAASGRPRKIPDGVVRCFPVVDDGL